MTKHKIKLGFAFYAMWLLLLATLVGVLAAVVSVVLLIVSVVSDSLFLSQVSAGMLLGGLVAWGLCSQLSKSCLDRWRVANGLEPYEWE